MSGTAKAKARQATVKLPGLDGHFAKVGGEWRVRLVDYRTRGKTPAPGAALSVRTRCKGRQLVYAAEPMSLPDDGRPIVACFPPSIRAALVFLVGAPSASNGDIAEHLLTVGATDGSRSYRLSAAARARHLLDTDPALRRSLKAAIQ